LFFCLDVGLIVSNTLKEAFHFDRVVVMGCDIGNNLLECRGWRSVRKLVQHTTNVDLISRIKRRVGQMKQYEKNRRSKQNKNDDSDYEDDKSNDENSSNDSTTYQDMDETIELEEEEDLSLDFMKKFTRLKWNCITHGLSEAALECHFPKSYIYKKLQEELDV
jgi:hypothetical protein